MIKKNKDDKYFKAYDFSENLPHYKRKQDPKDDLDKFAIIDYTVQKKKAFKKLRKIPHLSTNEKLMCYSFDLPLSVCKLRCNYYKEKICYVQNNYLHESFKTRKLKLSNNLKLAKTEKFISILKMEIMHTKQRIFRFFSSGDFIDLDNMKNIIKICEQLPSVKFWIPTSRDDLLFTFFETENLKKPDNCIIRLSNPNPAQSMPKFLIDFCNKNKIAYSCTTLNEKIVNCHCSLDSNESKCNNCEKCFDSSFNAVYLIHNITSRSNTRKLIKRNDKQ